ncbi:MAG: lectin like domain-containing protein, partial [Synergistaceae bacterium]|nr:lectin like domain-containing protein [Synergistaceae bacterium]
SKAPYPEHISSIYKPVAASQDFKVTGVYFASDDLHKLKNTETVDISNNSEARIKLLKDMILDCGAITVDIFHPDEDPSAGIPDDSKLLSAAAGYYTGDFGKTRANHAVLIVGWNDDFSRDDFGGVYSPDMKPASDGAWIVRNSWGTEYGDNGYYYVSYEENSLCNANAFIAESAVAEEKIYQYDPLGLVVFTDDGRYIPPEDPEGEEEEDPEFEDDDNVAPRNALSSAYGMDTSAFANIFTAGRNESLVSIAFYTPLPNAECEAKIYTGCSGSPTSGDLKAAFSKTLKYGGYNTLKLPSPVALAKGEKFSVVVKVTTPGKIVRRVPIESNTGMEDEVSKATFEKGRCWKSSNGTDWTDTVPDEWGSNVCLKAFTIPPAQNSSGGCNADWAVLLIFAAVPIMFKRNRKGQTPVR